MNKRFVSLKKLEKRESDSGTFFANTSDEAEVSSLDGDYPAGFSSENKEEGDLFSADEQDLGLIHLSDDSQLNPLIKNTLENSDSVADASLIPPQYPARTYNQDPLKLYLNEISKYGLITAEQEAALVKRMQETGDVEAIKALVTANLRLVVKIAFEYRSIYVNLLDLIQEGNYGLMKAVSKFDPTKGARLGYYASWWIRSYILKYLLENFRLVKIGTTLAQKRLYYHLIKEKTKLEAQGLLAAPKLLANKLNVKEKDVIEMQHRLSSFGSEVSLDAPIGGVDSSGYQTTHKDFLLDASESSDEKLAQHQLLELLRSKLPEFEKTLSEKEILILKMRMLSDEPQTLQQIADQYGLTRERARQIESKLISKLRDFLII